MSNEPTTDRKPPPPSKPSPGFKMVREGAREPKKDDSAMPYKKDDSALPHTMHVPTFEEIEKERKEGFTPLGPPPNLSRPQFFMTIYLLKFVDSDDSYVTAPGINTDGYLVFFNEKEAKEEAYQQNKLNDTACYPVGFRCGEGRIPGLTAEL